MKEIPKAVLREATDDLKRGTIEYLGTDKYGQEIYRFKPFLSLEEGFPVVYVLSSSRPHDAIRIQSALSFDFLDPFFE